MGILGLVEYELEGRTSKPFSGAQMNAVINFEQHTSEQVGSGNDPIARAAIGRRRWAIAEGYIPGKSHGPKPQMESHETACLLNTSERDAHVEITIFFSDRDPVGPYRVTVPAKRTKHLRFNELRDPQPIPRDTDYASLIESDVPIVVQHTRLDSRQDANALLSTIAYAGPE
jgi:hypothetical protein